MCKGLVVVSEECGWWEDTESGWGVREMVKGG